MKKILLSICLLCFTFQAFAQQMISYEKLQTFTVEDLEQLLEDVGAPSSILQPEFDVDVYKILYKTPYKHPDSLVQASMALAVPVDAPCLLPLASYQHGTQSKRANVPSTLGGGQWEVATIFASFGYAVAMPDYLGMGDSDPKVTIHPYIHYFSHANTVINGMRASRELLAEKEVALNGQIFLFGYSQGGYATSAAQKEIEEKYADEFVISGSAPMSGPYDLKVAQVEQIASDEPYATPGYLPFILFGYQSIYENLFNSFEEFLVPPYDSILPPLFYEGNTSIGAINNVCAPVPKDMIKDSVIQAFETNLEHPLRLNLIDNDLVEGWHPVSPTKIYYCRGDEQVSYLNAENAYDAWTAAGSEQLEKQNYGNLSHNDCALLCFLDARDYFNNLKAECIPVGTKENVINNSRFIYPNPTQNQINIAIPETNFTITVYNTVGAIIGQYDNTRQIAVNKWDSGNYFYRITTDRHTYSGTFLKY